MAIRDPKEGPARFCLLALPVLLAALAASCASTEEKIYRFQPAGETDRRSEATAKDIEIAASHLFGDDLRRYLGERDADPSLYGKFSARYLAFTLKIVNRGTSAVVFDPRAGELSDGKKFLYTPVEITGLYMDLRGEEGTGVEMGKLEKLVFARVTTVKDEEGEEKLILFPRPGSSGKAVTMSLDGFYRDGKQVPLVLEFEAVQVED